LQFAAVARKWKRVWVSWWWRLWSSLRSAGNRAGLTGTFQSLRPPVPPDCHSRSQPQFSLFRRSLRSARVEERWKSACSWKVQRASCCQSSVFASQEGEVPVFRPDLQAANFGVGCLEVTTVLCPQGGHCVLGRGELGGGERGGAPPPLGLLRRDLPALLRRSPSQDLGRPSVPVSGDAGRPNRHVSSHVFTAMYKLL
jgi:hypothetical protein